MSFFDALLGRARPAPARAEGLFAISTAQVTMQINLQAPPTNKAAVCFRSIGSGPFARMTADLTALLAVQARQSQARIVATEDAFGYQWLTVIAPAFEDAVTSVHLISSELQAQGYGEQLLAAVFAFADPRRTIYWVYNFKRGLFYPFVPDPTGRAHERDNALEMHVLAVLEKEMPVEKELERWYPLWNLPL